MILEHVRRIIVRSYYGYTPDYTNNTEVHSDRKPSQHLEISLQVVRELVQLLIQESRLLQMSFA